MGDHVDANGIKLGAVKYTLFRIELAHLRLRKKRNNVTRTILRSE